MLAVLRRRVQGVCGAHLSVIAPKLLSRVGNTVSDSTGPMFKPLYHPLQKRTCNRWTDYFFFFFFGAEELKLKHKQQSEKFLEKKF